MNNSSNQEQVDSWWDKIRDYSIKKSEGLT